MTRYAVPMTEMDALWREPTSSALVSAAVEEQKTDAAEIVSHKGNDLFVLDGPAPKVAALVVGLLETRLPGPMGRPVRVFAEGPKGWALVTEAPEVPELPDEEPGFQPDDDSPRIDREFSTLCGAQAPDVLAALRSSLQEHGCRDPLVVWEGRNILLDGHTRLALCQELDIPFDTVEVPFQDRDAARTWIIDAALGRRNLTAEQRDYLLGKRYLAERQSHGGAREASVHGDHLPSTAEKVASGTGVSNSTVRRAAKFAEAVDAIADRVGVRARTALLGGEIRLSRGEVVRAARQGVATLRELRAFRAPKAATDPVTEIASMARRLAKALDAFAPAATGEALDRLAPLWELAARASDLRVRLETAPATSTEAAAPVAEGAAP